MDLFFWQNSKLLPSTHCQDKISNLESLTFREDNFTYGLGNHNLPGHNLIHVGLGADPGTHGGIDGNVVISDNDLSVLDFIGWHWGCVLDLEDVGLFVGVVGGGSFVESDLNVEFGVAFHGIEEFELTESCS